MKKYGAGGTLMVKNLNKDFKKQESHQINSTMTKNPNEESECPDPEHTSLDQEYTGRLGFVYRIIYIRNRLIQELTKRYQNKKGNH